MSAVFHLVIFVLPPVALVASLINEQYDLSLLRFAATLIPITQRMMLNRWMQWDLWTAVTHVVGVLWFQYLGLVVVADRLLGRKAIWKGRKVE
jgi:hypothetical protein